jgi:hypothetical protein
VGKGKIHEIPHETGASASDGYEIERLMPRTDPRDLQELKVVPN